MEREIAAKGDRWVTSADHDRLDSLWKRMNPGASQCCEGEQVAGVRRRCLGVVTPEIRATGAMGCAVMCLDHFLAYHHAKDLAEVVTFMAARREAHRALRCARCGSPASWIDGAGEALCARHEDDY